MRSPTRVLMLAVLGLPLLLPGFGGIAMADSGQAQPAKAPKPSQVLEQAKQHSQQAGQLDTVQNNINVSPVTQVSIESDGDQSAMTWTNQSNDNTSDLEEHEQQAD